MEASLKVAPVATYNIGTPFAHWACSIGFDLAVWGKHWLYMYTCMCVCVYVCTYVICLAPPLSILSAIQLVFIVVWRLWLAYSLFKQCVCHMTTMLFKLNKHGSQKEYRFWKYVKPKLSLTNGASNLSIAPLWVQLFILATTSAKTCIQCWGCPKVLISTVSSFFLLRQNNV